MRAVGSAARNEGGSVDTSKEMVWDWGGGSVDGGLYRQGRRVGKGDGTGFEKWLEYFAQGTGRTR